MSNKTSVSLLLTVASFLAGCGEKVDRERAAESVPTKPEASLPQGTVLPYLIGIWKNPREIYKLNSDGTFSMHFDRWEQVGPAKTSQVRKIGDLSGKWSATDKALLLQVTKGEADSKHLMNLVFHDNRSTIELRPLFMKKGVGQMYKRFPK